MQDGHKRTSLVYEALEANPINQLNQTFRSCCLKVWARDFDILKQQRAHEYGYSERISKYLPGNNLFFLVELEKTANRENNGIKPLRQ